MPHAKTALPMIVCGAATKGAVWNQMSTWRRFPMASAWSGPPMSRNAQVRIKKEDHFWNKVVIFMISWIINLSIIKVVYVGDHQCKKSPGMKAVSFNLCSINAKICCYQNCVID